MPWTVVESYVQSRSGTTGGDAVVVAENYIGVIDGVSGKTRLSFDGMPADQFAASVVTDAIRELDASLDAFAAVATIGQALRERTDALGLGSLTSPPGAVLGMVSVTRNELWVVGDVNALLDGTQIPGCPPPTDAVLSALRSAYLQSLLLSGATKEDILQDDPSLVLLQPLLENQWVFGNHPSSPWSYGVLDGTDVPVQHVVVHDLSDVTEVALATDGFHFIAPTLQQTLAAHRAVVATDPLCIDENPQLFACGRNGWDDAAYVRLGR